MTPRIPVLALALVTTATSGFATARFSGEKGTRSHRTRLAAGQQHTCYILDDGTVDCWGRNTFGQLGDGSRTRRLSPVPVSNLGGSAISIAASAFHTCAVLSTGAVRCWGLNDSGQLGNGTATSSAVPVAVSALTGAVGIAAGVEHTCALRVDGTVWCWGESIVNGSPNASLVPVKVNLTGAVTIAAGGGHTCAVMADGTINCWGLNASGELGDGNNFGSFAPESVVSGSFQELLVDMNDVSAGTNFTCALRPMYCWGDNTFGQVGVFPPSTNTASPTSMGASGVALSAGAAHLCALQVDGTVMCRGLNDAGQVGIPAGGSVDTAHTVVGVVNAVEIAAGGKHTCAAIVDGTIRCWGDNTYGQHGNGTTGQTGVDSVMNISGTFLGRGVTAGNQFPCARRGTGPSACWGAGAQGQLGDSANVSSSNPVSVTGLTNAIAVTTGSEHACALTVQGDVECWGDNARGQLGNGNNGPWNQPTFLFLSKPVSFVAVSAGELHTCGLDISTGVYCWGAGDRGQIGQTSDSTSPIPVAAGSVRAIASGGKFTCALNLDGTVRCWGDNSVGQLGNGGTTSTSQPKTVPGLFNVVAIAAGTNHACALTAFGNVLCWGDNSRGQIGNNSTTQAPLPTTVQGITDAVSVSAGAFYTCAVRVGGTASCWGANDAGELGAKDSVDHLTPAPVAASVFSLPTGGTGFIALTNVVAIATGTSTLSPTHEQTCALLATGVVRCWGDNAQGEIGDGSRINQPRPTVVNSFAANVDPAAALQNEHVAIVTALVNCDVGDEAHISVTVDQNGATGSAHDSARCDGRLLRVPMRVVVHGRAAFQPGGASAQLEAIVQRGGDVVDDTHWTREIVLSTERR
jgi:alpha-tubulin suppressor-like RCC1 family protein